jgi:cytochrome c oxidase subunit 2
MSAALPAARSPMHTGLVSPAGRWWIPAQRSEKVWFAIAFAWCMVLFAMMPLWHWKGGQNASGIRRKVEPAAFQARVEQFVADYKIGELNGFPVVEPPAGADVYLLGRMWSWYPVLKLKQNTEYTLHLSSADVNHGFSLYPVNINFQIVPGYDYGLRISPTEAGEFSVICNEFCGVGHHLMLGKVFVTDASGNVPGQSVPIAAPPPAARAAGASRSPAAARAGASGSPAAEMK